jgi:hypothetical protein
MDKNDFYLGFMINLQFWFVHAFLASLQYPPFSYLQTFLSLENSIRTMLGWIEGLEA